MINIDETDKQIIDHLRQDGRATNRKLAKLAGISESAIANRIRRLIDTHTIKFTVQEDLYAKGLNFVVWVDLYVRGASADSVAEAASEVPNVITSTVCSTDPSVTLWVAAPNPGDIREVLQEQIPMVKGVQRLESIIGLDIVKYQSEFSPFENMPLSDLAIPKATAREKIVNLLKQDSRLSNYEIADRLGITEGTVRHHIRKLVSDREMRIGVVINPAVYGYTDAVQFRLSVEPKYISEACSLLRRREEVGMVAHVAGRYNLTGFIHTSSPESSASFFNEMFSQMNYINDASFSSAIKVCRHNYNWVRITSDRN
ncbi:MAG: AsnC family transcriptional regulator [Gammaproteobacteria bacterium]|nr:AsnC family transcriptional regulator [Gammaproteobacteria bacterium]